MTMMHYMGADELERLVGPLPGPTPAAVEAADRDGAPEPGPEDEEQYASWLEAMSASEEAFVEACAAYRESVFEDALCAAREELAGAGLDRLLADDPELDALADAMARYDAERQEAEDSREARGQTAPWWMDLAQANAWWEERLA